MSKDKNKATILILDFDGTITVDDVFDSIFDRFAGPGWMDAHDDYHREAISLKEAYLQMAAHFSGSRKELLEFVLSSAQPRAGFLSLLGKLGAENIKARIVSNGFDLYIYPLLEAWGLDPKQLEVTCHHAEIKDGKFEVKFNCHPQLASSRCLVGKAEIVRSYREKGWLTAFAGDGFSDSPAAKEADLVFARRTLARYCRQENIPFVELEDFHQVLDCLKGKS